MRVLLTLLCSLILASPAAAREILWPDLGQRIIEGVATSEFIWLRGIEGKVVRFDRATGERTIVATDVRDMVADGSRLWVLAGGTGGIGTLQDIRAAQPEPIRIGVDDRIHWTLVRRQGDVPAILKPDEFVIRTGDERWSRTSLPASLRGVSSAVVTAAGDLYVGFNRGEWGGGVRRVQTDGTISLVGREGEAPCEGDLNPACEPVVGLYLDPGAPDCAIAGTGLSHLGLSTGRLYRLCQGAVEPIWQTPVATQPDRWMMGAQRWPLDGLVETPDGWIGLSRDRYFRSRDGQVQEYPMPVFQDWSGIRISEDEDGVLFIVSACCWGSVENPTLYSTLAIPVGE